MEFFVEFFVGLFMELLVFGKMVVDFGIFGADVGDVLLAWIWNKQLGGIEGAAFVFVVVLLNRADAWIGIVVGNHFGNFFNLFCRDVAKMLAVKMYDLNGIAVVGIVRLRN